MSRSIKCKAYVTSWFAAKQEFFKAGNGPSVPGLIEPPEITLLLESKSLTDAVGSKDPAVVNKVLASIMEGGMVTMTLEPENLEVSYRWATSTE